MEKVLIVFFILALAYLFLLRKPKQAVSDYKKVAFTSEESEISIESDAEKQKEIAKLKSRLAELEGDNSSNENEYISKIQYDNPELANAFGELDKAIVSRQLKLKAALERQGLDTSKIDAFLKKYYNKK